MRIIRLTLKNSMLLNLLTFFLIVYGIVVGLSMKREAFPAVDFDQIIIRTIYPGASPENVEMHVTNRIEKAIKTIDGIEEIRSSSRENISSLFIKIDPSLSERTKIVTINDIQRAVDRIRDLPDAVKDPPLVTEITSGSMPIMEIVLSGDIPYSKLHNTADDISDIIENISGSKTPYKRGFYEEQYLVELNPDEMNKKHISLNNIMLSLSRNNINTPAGSLRTKKEEFLVRTIGELKTIEDIENIYIRSNNLIFLYK